MPYPYFANMREDDVDSIVAYLRTVRGVARTSVPSQPPFTPPPQPAPRIDLSRLPFPRADYADHAAALRGRYLATTISVCVSCHTPRENGQLATSKAFQGGLTFERASLGLDITYPEVVYSSNITPCHRHRGPSVTDALLFRMSARDPQLQMPPLGTEHEDLTGVAAVRAWIAALDGGGAKR